MKKVLSLILSLAILLSLLAGCGSSDNTSSIGSANTESTTSDLSSSVSNEQETSSKDTVSRLTDDQMAMSQHLGNWVDKLDEINNAKNGKFTFAIQTDVHHYDTSAEYLGKNLAALSNFVDLKYIANLGDLIRGYSVNEIDNPQNMRACLDDIVDRTINKTKCPVFMTVGNHDTNKMWCEKWSDHTEQFTPEEQLLRVYAPLKDHNGDKMITDDDGSYYYIDYPEDNVRVIMLNTSNGTYNGSRYSNLFVIKEKQAEWFKNEALNTDYAVIVMSHVPLNPNFTIEATGETTSKVTNSNLILDAVEEFVVNGGHFVAYLNGHEHEQIEYVDENGRLYLSFKKGGKSGEVVMVDTINKTISTIGLGEAKNREVKYN